MARILLADDNDVVARLVAHKLIQNGHEVEIASDGRQAIEAANVSRPDLCILDVMMPGMDGYQVMSTLRESADLADIPVILLTALGDDEDVVRGLRRGASDYMVKPFSPSELVARVDRLLGA